MNSIYSQTEAALVALAERQRANGDQAPEPPPPPPAPPEWTWQHISVSKANDAVTATRCVEYERGCADCWRSGGYVEAQTADGYEGYKTLTPCPNCRLLARRIELINRARLPSKFHLARFDWDLVKVDAEANPQGALTAWADTVIDEYRSGSDGDGGPSLAFCGPTGVGKSHAAYTLAKHCLASDVPVRWINWIALLDQLRQSFRDNAQHTARETWASVLKRPKGVLVIDDLGAGSVTAYSRGVACDLFERVPPTVRLIITTNGVPNDDGDHGLDTLIGSRAASRLAGVCGRGSALLYFSGADWRRGGAA